MQLFIIFSFFISFSLGVASLIFCLAAYLRDKNRMLIYIAFFFLIIAVRLMLNNFLFYLRINSPMETTSMVILYFIGKEFSFLLIFILPILFHRLLSVPFIKIGNILFIILILIVVFLEIMPLFTKIPTRNGYIIFNSNENLVNGLFFFTLVYPAVLTSLYYRKIQSPEIKRMIIIIIMFFISFVIMDIYWNIFKLSTNYYSESFLTNWLILLLFYLLWNSFFLIYSLKSFFSFKQGNSLKKNGGNPEILLKKGITAREMEIISYLIKGYNKQRIGEELFISENTVKKHIQHIYEKLNISNRVELVNLVKPGNI